MWLLASLAALIALLDVFGWVLLRDPDGSGVSGSSGAAPEEPRAAEGARLGPKEAEVPAVRGLSEQEARERLAEAGFDVGVHSQQSAAEDAGEVLEQSVASGKVAAEGSTIVLTIGEGPQVAKVPNLVGLTYADAEGELEQAGLLLGGVEEAPSETVPAGVIVAQDPPAGTALEPDSYVYLTTSVGPPSETPDAF